MSSLRLSELLVGLSRIADIGMGFEPGEAARAAVIAAELARELAPRLVGLPMRGTTRPSDPRRMHAEANKQVVRRFVDEYQTAANEQSFAELLHPEVVDRSRPPGIAEGAEGVRQQFEAFRAAFPDFHAVIHDQIAEGDKVVTRKVFHGTHGGELLGIAPTRREVQIEVIDIVRIEDRQIVEHWNVVDRLGLLQQLGALDAA